eukprot:6999569-Prymnesium_polylepis.1
MSGLGEMRWCVRSALVQTRDVLERHVKTTVQRGSRFVGRQHLDVRAGCRSVYPALELGGRSRLTAYADG